MVDSIMQINPVFPDYTRILMKNNMKTKWKMLALTALLSAGTTAANAADNGYESELGEDAYYADSSDYVADLYNEDSPQSSVGDQQYEANYEESAEEAQH
ncbi:secreted protein, partial [Rhodopirellula sallentina SM41]